MNKKKQVRRIFDSIAHRYDFLNHLLSAGIDFYWRKKALKLTKINSSAALLDVACGTGDFSKAALKFGVSNIVGADLSINMLRLSEDKLPMAKGLVQSVGENLPFKNDTFSNITVAFGVRNFYNISEAFNSFYEVLKENGKVTILEFRLPSNSIVKKFYLFYFNKILPLIGRMVSKDKEAYKYLPESVNEFDTTIDLVDLMQKANFTEIEKHSLTFGIVQVVIGIKKTN
ncbi:MAG: bifunctional demethylmenaquinone methyltransferase/2-methoxy-6-polyprenyl-1,4-benzoquinol methylase UbiE [Ignavibacteriae bacterium]|nr:bifunctional demethylmenaquinone methyltransferase/2-methoxy-6-polyprenyl-1,4-benzoquinol methylase UbiE [Ignavibacteriota bacterium]NOG99458.1 bifunctional demethylmenaquinone methyltransferase/2-methoxy-6-polyprenyl-1,4-benzoquinol methylase UbiE [Ignavibacteriota bacterium]